MTAKLIWENQEDVGTAGYATKKFRLIDRTQWNNKFEINGSYKAIKQGSRTTTE
jgi:hypothetical protein